MAKLISYVCCTNSSTAGCMFVLLNANVQHLVVIVILFPFHCIKLQATIIPSTCIYENHEYTNARNVV